MSYTLLSSDVEKAFVTLKSAEDIKIQLGAQIDGFRMIICDIIVIPSKKNEDDTHSGWEADLLLTTHYINEVLLRLMISLNLLTFETDEEKKKAAAEKPLTQLKITALLNRVMKSYSCSLMKSTMCWLFKRNEIEKKKKIVLAPSEGFKNEGVLKVEKIWGVKMRVSLSTDKVKTLSNHSTLHWQTTVTYTLKRLSLRQILFKIIKKFRTFFFSLWQLDDERAVKVSVVKCVQSNILRQYKVIDDKNDEPVSRLLNTVDTSHEVQRICKNKHCW